MRTKQHENKHLKTETGKHRRHRKTTKRKVAQQKSTKKWEYDIIMFRIRYLYNIYLFKFKRYTSYSIYQI